jgi:hypothetical protein
MQVTLLAAKHEAKRAREQNATPRPVLYIALELGAIDVAARLLALAAGEKWSRLILGQLGPAETTRVVGECRASLAALPIRVEVANPHGWPVERLGELVELHQPSLVVLDSLDLISDARTAIGYTARELARSHRIPILLLSNTLHALQGTVQEEENKPKPLGKGNPARLVGAAAESGGIESVADVVLVLAREHWEEGEHARAVWLAIAKQRAGGGGWAELGFDGSSFEMPEAHAR